MVDEIKSIREHTTRQTLGTLVRYYLGSTWGFDKWYEKAIMVALSMLGFLRILQWIF